MKIYATMLRIFVSILISIPSLTGSTWAWGDSWEAIRGAAETVKSLEAGFTQEKHLPILAKPLVSEGRLLYKAQDSLRWEYHTPIRNVLLMHNGRTERYVQTEGEWERDRTLNVSAMGVVMEQIRSWLGGQFEESAVFKATLGEGPTIVMEPKEAALARMIQRIDLKLAAEAGLMESVTIHEGENAFTRLVFTDAVLNSALDDSRFSNP